MKKIRFISNFFPHYRKSIWDLLLRSKQREFHFYFSFNPIKKIKASNLDDYNEYEKKRFYQLKNIYVKSIIIWQSGLLKNLINIEKSTLIFLGEMTIISTWLASIISKIQGHRIIFWGHGIYGNESYLVKKIRLTFLKLANHNLVYGHRAKNLLILNGFNPDSVSVIYNSINFYEQKRHFNKLLKSAPPNPFPNNDFNLLFVGRLTSKKRIDLLISAALKLNETRKINLLIIGDGPMRETLVALAEPLVKNNRCIFYGACYDEKILSEMIYSADLTVSPGNVGLTAIHSLSYGTPVCTHSNFNDQMPEAEAIKDGENGCFFQQNSLSSLTKNIIRWMDMNPKPSKEQVRAIVDQFYNPKSQQQIIERTL